MTNFSFVTFLLVLFLFPYLLRANSVDFCKPSGKVKGEKPPPDYCHEDAVDFQCCVIGKYYTTYKCSPRVSKTTKAILYLDSFEKGGDGDSPSKCDKKYHSDDTPVVSLSTGWYNGGRRCLNNITISGNGRSINAMVIDECDSSMGCDAGHDYLPPCDNNVVIASKAVWKGLGVPLEEWGELDVDWSDAK